MKTLLLISLLCSCLLRWHPLHISIVNVEINENTKQMDVSCKFYTDDFSLLFFHLYEKVINPETGKDFKAEEYKMINGYITDRLLFTSGNDTINLEFIKKEQNEESILLYFRSDLSGIDLKNILLSNKLMLDLNLDQTNLVMVSMGNYEKGLTFDINLQESVISEMK